MEHGSVGRLCLQGLPASSGCSENKICSKCMCSICYCKLSSLFHYTYLQRTSDVIMAPPPKETIPTSSSEEVTAMLVDTPREDDDGDHPETTSLAVVSEDNTETPTDETTPTS